MAYRDDWIQLIRQIVARYNAGNPRRQIDPTAALAVASAEGLGGGVGDQGTSFGPYQLHVGGALPAGRGRAWAESPAGIEYAIRQIGGVAGGLRGRPAVESIVRRFERPADPSGEIVRALGAMGSFADGNRSFAPAPPPSLPAAAGRAPARAPSAAPGFDLRSAVLQQLASGGDIDFVKLAQQRALAQPGETEADPAPPSPPPSPPPGRPASHFAGTSSRAPRGALAEAFYDPIGQWDSGRFSTRGIGGHSDHVHLSVTNPQAMIAAIAQAQKLGLAARENPYVDKVDPVHVRGSFHYRTFPGKYNGRSLGEGVDVSGDAARMAAYFRWALANLR